MSTTNILPVGTTCLVLNFQPGYIVRITHYNEREENEFEYETEYLQDQHGRSIIGNNNYRRIDLEPIETNKTKKGYAKFISKVESNV